MSEFDHNQFLEDLFLTRREMLARAGNGFMALGLMGMLGSSAYGAGKQPSLADQIALDPLKPRLPPLPARAKRVIFLFMNGGPSQVDTFDPKPMLKKYEGQAIPLQLPTERKTGAAFPSPFGFYKHGQSGIEVSELFPNVAKHVDDMCVIRSMHADVPNHEPSLMLMNSGMARMVRPSMGSWVLYGLGSENQNLPGFIAMCPGGYPVQESQNWQSGFLPGVLAGTYIDPNEKNLDKIIDNIRNHYTLGHEQRAQLDLVQKLNKDHLARRDNDSVLESRIQSYELAYRMQGEATDAFDVSKESKETQEMYGPGDFARQCLMARRLVERGVRFVQLYHGAGQPWDSHDDLREMHGKLAHESDQAIGALLTDLKRRGMLEDTLVIWGGEFGRTPTVELPTPGSNAGKMNGRDHNHYGFTYWLAGGGVKGGKVYGSTDEFGFAAADNPVHVHDLHATILYLLGFDHTKLTFRHAGRDYRLTDVYGNVVHDIIA